MILYPLVSSIAKSFLKFVGKCMNEIFKFSRIFLERRLNIYLIYNRVNLATALPLVSSYQESNLFIYSSTRNNREEIPYGKKIFCFEETRLLKIFIISRQLIFRNDRLFLPHQRVGLLNKVIQKLVKVTHFIDDGLDTYRDLPRNYSLTIAPANACYYFMKSPVNLASWTKTFRLIPTVEIGALITENREFCDLSRFSDIVIESPGIPKYLDKMITSNDIAVWEHPSPIKRTWKSGNAHILSSSKYGLERSLTTANSTIHIGETIVVVFLLSRPDIAAKIFFYASRSQVNNLSTIMDSINQDSRFTFIESN